MMSGAATSTITEGAKSLLASPALTVDLPILPNPTTAIRGISPVPSAPLPSLQIVMTGCAGSTAGSQVGDRPALDALPALDQRAHVGGELGDLRLGEHIAEHLGERGDPRVPGHAQEPVPRARRARGGDRDLQFEADLGETGLLGQADQVAIVEVH